MNTSATSATAAETAAMSVGVLADLLRAEGIEGLCHPTTDTFAPFFPRCDVGMVPGTSLDSADVSRELHVLPNQPASYYIQNGLLALVCVLMAALAAGLTMGLLSLDPLMLRIKMRAGTTEEERNQAKKLLGLVEQHHLLLVTLLLLNSMANEALPLFLDKLVPSYVAVILSVTLVLFFGEIIPSAVFTGPNQLNIASMLSPLVRVFMCLLLPLSYPIAKLLDAVLHEDESSGLYNRGELSALVRIQYEERLAAKKHRKEAKKQLAKTAGTVQLPANGQITTAQKDFMVSTAVKATKQAIERRAPEQVSDASLPITSLREADNDSRRGHLKRQKSVHVDEVKMVEGALLMKTKTAIDAYTPLRNIYAIPIDTVLDEDTIVDIYSSGFSRVPVFHRNPEKPKDITLISGILRTKQLMVVNTTDERKLSTLPLNIPFCVSPTMDLVDLTNWFQTGGTPGKGGHMAIVCARPQVAEEALSAELPIPPKAGVMGIITLEDVLEHLIQEKIYDESDNLHVPPVERAFKRWRAYTLNRKSAREQQGAASATPDSAEATVSTPLIRNEIL